MMKKLSAQKKFLQHQRLLKKSMQDPASLYLNSLAPSGRRSVNSLLRSAIKRLGFSEALIDMPWYLLEYQHIDQVKKQMQQEDYAISSINLMLAGFQGVMNACFNLGLISGEELMRFRKVKNAKGAKVSKGRSLSNAETSRIMDCCRQDRSLKGRRDYAIITMMLATGLRRAEIVGLLRSDYNSRNGELLVRDGKGHKERLLYLPINVRRQLRHWLKLRGGKEGPFFTSFTSCEFSESSMSGNDIYRLVRQISAKVRIENIAPHDLRRTFITNLLEVGVDINSVRKLAGHASVQTTVLYDRRDDKAQKKAMQLLSKAFSM